MSNETASPLVDISAIHHEMRIITNTPLSCRVSRVHAQTLNGIFMIKL